MMTVQEYMRLNLADIHDPAVGMILDRHQPEMTVCPECLTPEFAHESGCKLAEKIEEMACQAPSEWGPLVYVGDD